jgi:exosortase
MAIRLRTLRQVLDSLGPIAKDMMPEETAAPPMTPPRSMLPGTKRNLIPSLATLRMVFGRDAQRIPIVQLSGWILLCIAAVFSYAACLAGLVGRWWSDPDYLHGFLVPVFAAYLLWSRREMVRGLQFQGSQWGLALLGICAAMRWASAYYYYELLDPASLIPGLAGLVLFLGGWKVLRWSAPSIAMLVFMIPLPGFLATLMAHPLQRMATIASTYMIQTVGVPAVAEGNVISLGDSQIGVAEACNGLRNMMLFIAVCSAVAFTVKRPLIEKAIIMLSAVPIALIANLVRITATAVLHSMSHHDLANTTYHDLAGWFMMPLAVVLLWVELAILRRVFVAAPTSGPLRA